jgi:dTMP kinase
MANKKKGLLITLEGGEGAGKTTQIVRLKDNLVKEGKDVIVLREPGGTVISEQIREVVLSAKNVGMSFTTEVLLFQAARAQIYREIVLPSLELGKVVIMDRSLDSSVIYQGMVRGFGVDLINQLNEISTKKTYPDLTFLLDVPVEIGLQRRADDGGINRLDMEAKDFHEKVRNAYLTIARKDIKKNKDKARWQIIDASRDLEAVEAEMWQAVTKFLKAKETKNWEDEVGEIEIDYREE